jgi:cytochrome c2
MLGVSLVVGALSTGNKIGLAVVGGAFIIFALISAFVLPARYPNFPGRHVGWYVAISILFLVAMLSAVLVFGREKAESRSGPPTTTTSAAPPTTTAAPAPSGGKGDPAAGKAVFASAGCGGCHTLKAAGSSGTVGPNLDQLKPPFDRVVHQVQVGGGPMPSFKDALSAKQIQDVAAFVVSSTHA